MQLTMCDVILYEEHYPDISEIVEVCKSYESIKEWATIKHDKEPTEKPHYHVALKFGNSFNTNHLLKWFKGLTPSNIGKIKGRWTSALAYLTHENATDKIRYERSDVRANFEIAPLIEEELLIRKNKRLSFEEILEKFKSGEFKMYEEDSIPDNLKGVKAWQDVKQAYQMYSKWKVSENKKNKVRTTVIFMCGSTAVGKTRFAQEMFGKEGLSVYVSGASNDPMQGYEGQDVLFLDDIRDTAFEYSDLLKLTDNYTRTETKSRYYNKMFIGSYIVLSSSTPLEKWYSHDPDRDRLQQLIRRIDYQYLFANGQIHQFNISWDVKRKYYHEEKDVFDNPYPELREDPKPQAPAVCILSKSLKSKLDEGRPNNE